MLTGKNGLVLGVANERSIAYAIVKKLSESGCNIVASCLNQKAFDSVLPSIRSTSAKLKICNLQNPGELETLVAESITALGSFDFLVHSVAFAPAKDLHGSVTESSKEGFLQAMDISCHSFARAAQLVTPHMPRGGSLITMSYLGADEVVPHYGLMGPVKAALESCVRYIAGPILTRAASGSEHFDDLMQRAIEKSPLKRLVTQDEVADLTAFLCSDQSSGMTGQTIYIDAGYHAVD
jgi:enoyl-[acyl-carrier protein] reductase I